MRSGGALPPASIQAACKAAAKGWVKIDSRKKGGAAAGNTSRGAARGADIHNKKPKRQTSAGKPAPASAGASRAGAKRPAAAGPGTVRTGTRRSAAAGPGTVRTGTRRPAAAGSGAKGAASGGKQSPFQLLWTGAIILSFALVIITLIFVSCGKGAAPDNTPDALVSVSPQGSDIQPDVSTEPTPTPTPTPGPTVLEESADQGQEYIDKFVFLGDSTTYGLSYYEVLNKTQVWVPSNGTLSLSHWSFTTIFYPDTGEEIPITDALDRKQPEYMVITLGVNGVAYMDENYFTSEYTNLVNAVKEHSPNTKLILNSIYPIAASYASQDSINNSKIDTANGWIKQIAENTGTRFVDTNSALKGSDGWLPENLQNGDGLHLTPDGYNIVINYIRTHGYK